MSLPHITEHEMDSGRKAGYYAAILDGTNDHGLWSLSKLKQFVSFFLISAGSDFTFTPKMHKVIFLFTLHFMSVWLFEVSERTKSHSCIARTWHVTNWSTHIFKGNSAL